jgi:pimeloyl-ACP methyl ester carboxylesterase
MKIKMTKITLLICLSLIGCSKLELDSERKKIYDDVSNQVLNEALKNVEIGTSSFVETEDGIQIWYEHFDAVTDSVKGTILLIGGITETAIAWEDYTYQPLLEAGFNVIRFDNREVGRSTWTQNKTYDLSDMARDALAILNDLHIDSVHMVGRSMGGMIAQEFAFMYPEKVKSLTLIYTTGYTFDESLPFPDKEFEKKVGAAYYTYNGSDIKSEIKLALAITDALNVNPLSHEDLLNSASLVRFEIEKRRGYNDDAFVNQEKAIKASGPRWDRLNKLIMPVLIIHGEKDPIAQIPHGKKLATHIPHAKTVWAENYGHHMTIDFSEIIVTEIIDLIE